MKLVASLGASPQGTTKTSDHGTFSLYMNIIFQIMRAFLTDHGYVGQYNQGGIKHYQLGPRIFFLLFLFKQM